VAGAEENDPQLMTTTQIGQDPTWCLLKAVQPSHRCYRFANPRHVERCRATERRVKELREFAITGHFVPVRGPANAGSSTSKVHMNMWLDHRHSAKRACRRCHCCRLQIKMQSYCTNILSI
jgi:hypothetical protein